MAKGGLTNCYVNVNGNVISNRIQSVDFASVRDTIEVTAMGATAKEYVLGIADANVQMTAFQDIDTAALDAVLYPLHITNTPFVVEVRPTSAGRSASNPAYTITALLPEYHPINGDVGSAFQTDLQFINASQTGVSRLLA